ncbi:RNA repair domain-containing protein [Candidatus Bathyarchaeota archaeon]|nr:RNA repair domain-containing protein [Candidatus Bathyarchaeota archaeon]
MTLRDILNRIRWDSKEKRICEITYIHRGASKDERMIPFSCIEEIHSSWFTYFDPGSGEVTIPFHRILQVQDIKSGEVLWKKRGRQL